MIPVTPVQEPAHFDRDVRVPGNQWLADHPLSKRLSPFWSQYLNELRIGSSSLCGYAAMLDPTGGTVDHYLSSSKHRGLAYEWSNYRFASGLLNNIKRTKDDQVLDPFEVQDGWFEIQLPSLQMVLTTAVPRSFRTKAAYTLKHLKLQDDERVIRWRQSWYELYVKGDLTLKGLRAVAPLIAAAVDKQASGIKSPRQKKTASD